LLITGMTGSTHHLTFTLNLFRTPKWLAEYRQIGFGAVVAFKADGIARGTSHWLVTGDGKANNIIIKNKTSANYSLLRSRSADLYPASQFGIIALLRQV